jgi:hypothetical protein
MLRNKQRWGENFDVILVSYESGDFRSCPAEWADDKIQTLAKMGLKVALVTSFASSRESSQGVHVFKVPSLSHRDLMDEVRRRALGESAPTKPSLSALIAASTVGKIFDQAFRFLAGADSWGRYSWVLSSLPVIWRLTLLNPSAKLLATGGPSSSQVSLTIASRLFINRSPILEFQDPFVGTEMIMSKRARMVLESLERWLVSRARKVVMVTDGAKNEMHLRHPDTKKKIVRIYPGSPDFGVASIGDFAEQPVIEIVHLGTLYGSRNLDLVFQALDRIYAKDPNLRGRIMIRNLGNIYLENEMEYLTRFDFARVDPMPRRQALTRAAESSALLLIQHTDTRSLETIPYKTYDYLNLNLPILGILNNPELAHLVLEAGGVTAAADSVDEIEKALLLLISWGRSSRGTSISLVGSMENQVRELLS